MKNIFILVLLMVSAKSFCQTVSVEDMIDFIKKPTHVSENYLHLKGFLLSDRRMALDDTIKTYRKRNDLVVLGWTWRTKEGDVLRESTYMTIDKTNFILLFGEVKSRFTMGTSSYEANKGRTIMFEDNYYKVQAFLSEIDSNFSSIKIVEK